MDSCTSVASWARRSEVHADIPYDRGTSSPTRRDRPSVRAAITPALISVCVSHLAALERIRTENAEANEVMLKINDALGYRHCKSRTEWQLETDRAMEHLATR